MSKRADTCLPNRQAYKRKLCIEGYLYIYACPSEAERRRVANESAQTNVDVYFDDIKLMHSTTMVAQTTDYYPYGSILQTTKTNEENHYRYGYQRQYAEEDEETGLTHFELRDYGSRIGRWTSTDPYRQYVSSYVGMGNNPINRWDSDGGFDDWYRNKETGTIMYREGSDVIDGYLNLGASWNGKLADGTYFFGFEDGSYSLILNTITINSPKGTKAQYLFNENIRDATANFAPFAYGAVVFPALLYYAPAMSSGYSSAYLEVDAVSIWLYTHLNAAYVATTSSAIIALQRTAYKYFTSPSAVQLRLNNPKVAENMRQALNMTMDLKLPQRASALNPTLMPASQMDPTKFSFWYNMFQKTPE